MSGSALTRADTDQPWDHLFGTGGVSNVPMWLLRRKGRPFLLLAHERDLAFKGLDLYPAQTMKARLAKRCLGLALRSGLRLGLEPVLLKPDVRDGFPGYLSHLAGLQETRFPKVALLVGNPRVPGQRHTLLLFDASGKPCAVVKAGFGEDSERLIAHEENFLRTAPAGTPGVPSLRSAFHDNRIRALATDFFEGTMPPSDAAGACAKLLSSWIRPGPKRKLQELLAWRRLESATGPPLSSPILALGQMSVATVIFHGDFAPWNIRTKNGQWMPVDWERGELEGIPMWDWLHFVVQPAVLVAHASPAAVLRKIEGLIGNAAFGEYARGTGIAGSERPLALAYLHYCLRVLVQTEGFDTVRAVSNMAEEKWFKGR